MGSIYGYHHSLHAFHGRSESHHFPEVHWWFLVFPYLYGNGPIFPWNRYCILCEERILVLILLLAWRTCHTVNDFWHRLDHGCSELSLQLRLKIRIKCYISSKDILSCMSDPYRQACEACTPGKNSEALQTGKACLGEERASQKDQVGGGREKESCHDAKPARRSRSRAGPVTTVLSSKLYKWSKEGRDWSDRDAGWKQHFQAADREDNQDSHSHHSSQSIHSSFLWTQHILAIHHSRKSRIWHARWLFHCLKEWNYYFSRLSTSCWLL